jgi:imidazole glycerol-phosphate synthase subunit HisH
VTLIDYQAGNLTSVLKALRHLGAEMTVAAEPSSLETAERLILPGVGHFGATRRLDETGLTPAIRQAIGRGMPFLGICVGMQWLLKGSAEAPDQPGLGHFLGQCERFPAGEEKVPHVGWNRFYPRTLPASQLFMGIELNKGQGGEYGYAYFTHSYYVSRNLFAAAGPATIPCVAAITKYALAWNAFSSAIEHRNVFGVQFHPEMSGETGLKVLRNFLEWKPAC